MYKNVLESIAGVEIYPIISLFLFILVFAVMVYWALKSDKKYLEMMAKIPLNQDTILADKV